MGRKIEFILSYLMVIKVIENFFQYYLSDWLWYFNAFRYVKKNTLLVLLIALLDDCIFSMADFSIFFYIYQIFKGTLQEQEERLLRSSTLYIGNLSYYTTEEQVNYFHYKSVLILRFRNTQPIFFQKVINLLIIYKNKLEFNMVKVFRFMNYSVARVT